MLRRIKRILNTTLGEGVSTGANADDLFNISTGHVTLEVEGYKSVGKAGLCFNTVDSSDFDHLVGEIEDLLDVSEEETGTEYEVIEDEYGYTWVIVDDPNFEDLVTSINMASETLIDDGYSESLLCAVFGFQKDKEVYWIYNFKRGAWYPFVPSEKKEEEEQKERDSTAEFKLRSMMSGELNVEEDESRWYPLWDVPF